MEKKRVTRQDVADRAGVSPTIVSYVINNNRYVDAGKRERVQKALKELGYRPNSMARALKGKQSNHILFIVDDLQSEYFGKIIKHIDSWAYQNNYFISLCESRNQKSFVEQIYQRYFDGVIIASGTFKQKYIQELMNTHIPVVLLEMRRYNTLLHAIYQEPVNTFPNRFALINSGLYEGARLCSKTLMQQGRSKLVFVDSLITSSFSGSGSDDFRLQGFVDELQSHGYTEYEHYHIITDCNSEEDLQHVIEGLVRKGFAIDGVFGRTDSVAVLAMYKLIEMGHEIPRDCSVIGVNNSRISRYTSPKLSTLEIDRPGIAQAIITLLGSMFSANDVVLSNAEFSVAKDATSSEIQRIQLATTLIKRQSLL